MASCGVRAATGASPLGPYVLPGTYNVALMIAGKSVETKTLKVVLDPELQMTDAQRKRHYDMTMELHDLQRRGTLVAEALTMIDGQMADVTTKVKDSKAPESVKTQFDTFAKDFAALKSKFGVGGGRWGRSRWRRGGGGGRGGGGRGGGGADCGGCAVRAVRRCGGCAVRRAAAAVRCGCGGCRRRRSGAVPQGFGGGADGRNDLVARAGMVKGDILTFSDWPSDTPSKESNEVKLLLTKALSDANAFIVRSMTMSQTLKNDITLNVPPPVKRHREISLLSQPGYAHGRVLIETRPASQPAPRWLAARC
jgi:hypothetical protein